jgi:hypothetical protein
MRIIGALLVAIVALGAAFACNNSTAPTSVVPANIVPSGVLSTTGCSVSGAIGQCSAFQGTAQNMSQGCAINVQGVITTFTSPGNVQIGSASWTYTGGKVTANQLIAFSGGQLTVGVPLIGGWVFQNNISFTSVAC